MQPVSSLLAREYFAAEKGPATVVHDFSRSGNVDDGIVLTGDDNDNDGRILAYVVPNVMTDEECEELIASSESHGIIPNEKYTGSLRTAKRSNMYRNEELSERVFQKLQKNEIFLKGLQEDQDGMGELYGLHSNWRILRYDPSGDKFGAHQDQMDTIQIKHDDGTKDLVASSHTLLINLSRDGVQGGATRFYPNSKVRSKALDQYNTSVDVILPRGWALVFRQRGLIHAGQPVTDGSTSKYVAQAGVLRLLPRETFVQPSVFRLAPGLPEAVAEMTNSGVY